MMRSKFVLLFGLLLFIDVSVFSQSYSWVSQTGGVDYDASTSISTDPVGNIVTVGFFTQTVDFNPGAGVNNFVSIGANDVFIQKLDSAGNFIWAKTFGTPANDYGYSVECDSLGNIYCVGTFYGSGDFDPGPGIITLNSGANWGTFIVKYNSDGDLIWAKELLSTDDVFGHDIVLTDNNTITIVGYFSGTADLNPNAGVETIASNGLQDVFVVKLDRNANFRWAFGIGGSNSDVAYAASEDSKGNIILSGGYSGSVDFDHGSGTDFLSTSSAQSMFLLKIDSVGNHLWAKSTQGSTVVSSFDIKIDVFDNILSTGIFYGSADFDPDTTTFELTPNSSSDIFICKYEPNGSFVWASMSGSVSAVNGRQLFISSNNSIFVLGDFISSMDYNTGGGSNPLLSNGASDVFLIKLDSNGTNIWTQSFGGTGSDVGRSIVLYNNESIFLTGIFSNTVVFDSLNLSSSTITAAGNDDYFILSLSDDCFPPYMYCEDSVFVCENETIQFSESGGEASSWTWSGPNGFSSSFQNPSLSSAMQINTGMYYVIGYNASGCSNLDSVFVEVQQSPTVSILGSSDICYGDSITIAGDGADNYIWNTTETTPSILIYPTTTTTYSVTGSNGICIGTASFTVTVLPSPNAIISGDSIICPGTSALLSVTGGISYYWSTGENSSSISVNPSSTTYYFVVVSDGTCTGSDTVHVDLYPEVLADAGTDTTISEGESVILSPSGGITYEWSPDVYLSCTLCENPISTPQSSITYTVLVTDANGCSKTDSVLITLRGNDACGEIFIPTAFTPNNDGYNDDFKVLGNCIATIHLEVYDRWGGIVFKTDDPMEGWKGDKDGSQLNGGIYTYIYFGSLTDGSAISGDGKVNMIK